MAYCNQLLLTHVIKLPYIRHGGKEGFNGAAVKTLIPIFSVLVFGQLLRFSFGGQNIWKAVDHGASTI